MKNNTEVKEISSINASAPKIISLQDFLTFKFTLKSPQIVPKLTLRSAQIAPKWGLEYALFFVN
ncbi:hypothetical protein SAMN05661012_03065 [Chitinophaga sancti]|uniref:Uncharacterized protein n=1 Tax=Chitinophaga sancti TaxID=1004 RepID=A0A1K1QUJ0_9BACT|nr:hypothetical protein SAMN05661012_03065 [Chitinophaga sancti]